MTVVVLPGLLRSLLYRRRHKRYGKYRLMFVKGGLSIIKENTYKSVLCSQKVLCIDYFCILANTGLKLCLRW